MRYTYETVLAHLKAKIIEEYGSPDDRPSRHKLLYQDMGIGKGEWSRKFRGETKFNFDEISFLSERFGGPPGWPYISWDAASANERALELLARTTASVPIAAEPGPPPPAAPSGQPERRRRGGRK